MPTSLHIGKKRVQTLVGSDGSVIPLGSLTAAAETPAIVSVSVAADNQVTLTGVAAGVTTITYTAPGYQPLTDNASVSPLPTMVLTTGPEI